MDAAIAHLMLIALFMCMYAVLICVEIVIIAFKRAAVRLSNLPTTEQKSHSEESFSKNSNGSKSLDCMGGRHRFLSEVVFVLAFVLGCAMTIGYGVSLGSVLSTHALPIWYAYLLGVLAAVIFTVAMSCRFAGLSSVRRTGKLFIYIMKSWYASIISLFVYIVRYCRLNG